MKHLPTLKTKRLHLTELRASDIPEIVQKLQNKNIAQYTINLPQPYAEKDAIFWLNLAYQGFKNGTEFIWAIRGNEGQEFIGGIGLTMEKRFNRAEISYWIAEPFWGKGYATEATKRIIQYGFEELGLQKLTSSYLAENTASGKVMQKSGMQQEGLLRQHILRKGKYHDFVVYGIIKEDYQTEV